MIQEATQLKPHERLRIFREHLNMMQKEFAEVLSMAPPSYNAIERGKVKINARHLNPLKYLYGLNPEWLMKGEGEMIIEKPSQKSEQECIALKEKIKHLEEENALYKKMVSKLLQEHTDEQG